VPFVPLRLKSQQFIEKYLNFLKLFEIEYDERYIYDRQTTTIKQKPLDTTDLKGCASLST
jgi:hypothetical protein